MAKKQKQGGKMRAVALSDHSHDGVSVKSGDIVESLEAVHQAHVAAGHIDPHAESVAAAEAAGARIVDTTIEDVPDEDAAAQ